MIGQRKILPRRIIKHYREVSPGKIRKQSIKGYRRETEHLAIVLE